MNARSRRSVQFLVGLCLLAACGEASTPPSRCEGVSGRCEYAGGGSGPTSVGRGGSGNALMGGHAGEVSGGSPNDNAGGSSQAVQGGEAGGDMASGATDSGGSGTNGRHSGGAGNSGYGGTSAGNNSGGHDTAASGHSGHAGTSGSGANTASAGGALGGDAGAGGALGGEASGGSGMNTEGGQGVSGESAGGTHDDGGAAGQGGFVTRRVFARDNGVELTSTPSLSHLSEQVVVLGSDGKPAPWAATADQPWLKVTAMGAAGEPVVISADITNLEPGSLRYATVTLKAPSDIDVSDRIRVGLWISSEGVPSQKQVSITWSSLVTDPIRPYAYVTAGANVLVYNVFSGELVDTLRAVAPALGNMAVSSDGSRLFVIDNTNFKLVPIDLDTRTVGTAWPLAHKNAAFLAYARPRGRGLVVAGWSSFYDASSGAPVPLLSGIGYIDNYPVAVSQDGSKLCITDIGFSPSGIGCHALGLDESSGEVTLGEFIGGDDEGNFVASNGQDVAVNADGSRVFAASGAPYFFRAYDAAGKLAQILDGEAYPNNVEVTEQGITLAGGDVLYGPTDVWVYDADGFLLATHKLAGYANGLVARQLKASGDGLRIVALTSDPYLVFATTVP